MPSLKSATNKRFRAGFDRLENRINLSLTIAFDYSYDSSGFFAANPAAKAVLQEAGQILGDRINDHLAEIAPDLRAGNNWSEIFTHPSTGSTVTINNPTVAANTIVVYAGGHASGITTTGAGIPGGLSGGGSADWTAFIQSRGATGAAGTWGGTVSFDASTPWSFASSSGSPASDRYDFLTESLHELEHVLGIGNSSAWYDHVNFATNTFNGPHSVAMYGSVVPLNKAGQFGQAANGNWGTGLSSFGQEPLGDVTPLLLGQRKALTSLDWAGLQDIGWHVDHLAFTSSPGSSETTGKDFGRTISVLDPAGHVDTTFNGTVTLNLGANPGVATLSGNLTATAKKGIATFQGLSLDEAGIDYTLNATTTSLVSMGTSDAFDVSDPVDYGHFVLTTQPPESLEAGATFGFVVSVRDSSDHLVSDYDGPVTLELASGPAGSAIVGNLVAYAQDGVATFSGLSALKAGGDYRIRILASPISEAVTSAFTVTPAAASQLVFSSQPPANATSGKPFGLKVAITDAYGNLKTDRSDSITLSLAGNSTDGGSSDAITVSAVNGIATFLAPWVSQMGLGYAIQANAAGLGTSTSSAFDVAPAAPVSPPASPAGNPVVTSNPSAGNPAITTNPAVSGQVPSIIRALILYSGKGKKRKVIGIELDANTSLDASRTLDASNYSITEFAKKGRKTIARKVSFRASFGPGHDVVRLNFSGKHPFANGGDLVVNSTMPGGVVAANGVALSGGDASYVILKDAGGIR